MTDFIYKPRTGDEMKQATGGLPVHVYSDICKQMKYEDPVGVLMKACFPFNKCVILLQDPKNMNSGHWTGLEFNPAKREAYFFSSYGGKPDEEKNRWIDLDGRIKSNQERNPINNALKLLCARGWTIFYNDHPYQVEGDKTATCGIWTAAFLNSGMNPDDFAEDNERRERDVFYYYKRYFLKE